MFDFGFSELLVVFVVALVVLGPTRLPGLVRKVGRWVGKARSMAREFREQLESEVNVEELNRAVKRHVMDDPPHQPSSADASASPPPDAGDAFSSSGYPYGVPTDTSATSADPAVTASEDPQAGDDTYSHAHAPDAAPEPWVPEADEPALTPDTGAAAETAVPGDDAGDRRNRDA